MQAVAHWLIDPRPHWYIEYVPGTGEFFDSSNGHLRKISFSTSEDAQYEFLIWNPKTKQRTKYKIKGSSIETFLATACVQNSIGHRAAAIHQIDRNSWLAERYRW